MKDSRRKHVKGFTLLELLMVVIIIGILATIALPQYFKVTERARTAGALQILSSIRGSEMRFRAASATTVYDNSAGLTGLDVSPIPAIAGFGVPTATGTAAGSNVQTIRAAAAPAPFGGAIISIDLDTGTTCGSPVAAATDWGLPPPGPTCP